ncbi:MAG: hypothetical protein IJG82_00630 [Atopobiaceae bacterium]|nr:hypothetical protein [Atopobiaceae bacterium]MBQ6523692.1 hypothetical protein [Atopobiaceae bacterium]
MRNTCGWNRSEHISRSMPLLVTLLVMFLAFSVLLSACGVDEADEAGEAVAVEEVDKEKSTPDLEPVVVTEPEIDVSVLSKKTDYLEYSPTESTDPLNLVSCEDPEIEVTCDVAEVPLAEVGVTKLVYHLSRGEQQKDVAFPFIVRDTKSPQVELAADEVTIDQGESVDLRGNVNKVTDPADGDIDYADAEPSKIAESGRQYDRGWYVISSNVDVNTPGVYYAKVTACDVNGNRTEKEFKIVVNEVVVAAPVAEPEPEPEPEPQRNTQRYILNTNTHKFHYPGCSSVDQMAEKNKWDTDEYTREEIIAMGYEPCKRCNP